MFDILPTLFQLRRRAEELNMTVEDEADLDKSALTTKLEKLEHRLTFLDSRAQNYDDLTRKAAETEEEMKYKYADLSKRHDETLQKYINTVEENRSLRTSQTSTPIKEQRV